MENIRLLGVLETLFFAITTIFAYQGQLPVHIDVGAAFFGAGFLFFIWLAIFWEGNEKKKVKTWRTNFRNMQRK